MKRTTFFILLLAGIVSYTQANNGGLLTPALPFLDINTNTRTGAMGEIGVVSSGFYRDGAYFQNPALLSNQGKHAGVDFSYMPWMMSLDRDISLMSINAFSSINNNSLAYRYKRFSGTEFSYTDVFGNQVTDRPVEFIHQLTYSHSLNNLSLGLGIKYISSKWRESNPNISAQTVAFDIGIAYRNEFIVSEKTTVKYTAGGSIINFGPKVEYSNVDLQKNFIPTSLGLGAIIGPDFYLSDKMRLSMEVAYQLSKYLIPTPPVYAFDSVTNAPIIGDDGNFVILEGKDYDVSPFRALYQSFYDAPGGFNEEIQELRHQLGAEVRLNIYRSFYFATRIGRYIEHENKGNRKYNTWGLGVGIYGFAIDYKRIETSNESLDNTWALTMGFRTNFDQFFRF